MNNNQDLKNTYNKIAKDWNKDHSVDTWWISGADIFCNMLNKESKILDLGCAGGLKSNYIKNKGFKNIKGFDFSEEMIKDARERYPDIQFDVFDIYNLAEYTEKFDGIFCQAVLLHIPKDKILGVLKSMKDLLNDGGLLYIAVKEIKDSKIEEEIKIENDYGYEYERFFSYFTLDELKGYLNDLGLSIVYENVINSGRSNWINLIGKN